MVESGLDNKNENCRLWKMSVPDGPYEVLEDLYNPLAISLPPKQTQSLRQV